MLKTLKSVFSLGLKAAKLTKRQAKNHIKPLVKRRLLSDKDARRLVGLMLKEAKDEGSRVKNFVKQEVKREISKARSLMSKRKKSKKKRL